jgi:predicted nucleotidyltransferase
MARTKPRRISPRSLDDIKKILQEHKPELSEKWKSSPWASSASMSGARPGKSSDLDLLVEIDDHKWGC